MIKASQDRHSFEVKQQLSADPSRQLPAAEVMITFHVNAADELRPLAGYLELQGRGDVAETRDFDDGLVMVDLDAQGQPIGIEYLSGRGPRELPEFSAFVKTSNDAVLRAAATQLLFNWKLAEALLKVLVRGADEGLMSRLAHEKTDEAWQQELAFA